MTTKLNSVLLIDDDEPTNFIAKMIVSKADLNNSTEAIQSGTKALEFLKKEELTHNDIPDLIFLDINMPTMNGWEFLEEYKELEIHKKKKIYLYMLTTSMNDEDEYRSQKYEHVDGFLIKPLTLKAYTEIVKKHFV
ncbi:MAG: response regulator [Flavobacteriales bacterium]